MNRIESVNIELPIRREYLAVIADSFQLALDTLLTVEVLTEILENLRSPTFKPIITVVSHSIDVVHMSLVGF